jgi:hypothetical protein
LARGRKRRWRGEAGGGRLGIAGMAARGGYGGAEAFLGRERREVAATTALTSREVIRTANVLPDSRRGASSGGIGPARIGQMPPAT